MFFSLTFCLRLLTLALRAYELLDTSLYSLAVCRVFGLSQPVTLTPMHRSAVSECTTELPLPVHVDAQSCGTGLAFSRSPRIPLPSPEVERHLSASTLSPYQIRLAALHRTKPWCLFIGYDG